MFGTRIIDTIEEQQWIRPVDKTVRSAVQGAIDAGGPAGQKVANLLHGTWLGHPLHPVLTDVPVGAWTAAMMMDLIEEFTGNDEFAPAADAAIGLGLVGAAGSAVTGLTDWKDADSQSRRIGIVHAALNIAAVLSYAISLLLRRSGSRDAGRGAALAGYTLMSAAAYLGGDLVYRQRIGVNHTTDEALPTNEFIPVLAEADLPEGEMRKAQAGKWPVVLTRCDGEIYAIAEVCTHLGGPLAEGELHDCSVKCPWHGSVFSFKDGHVIDGPATIPIPSFETRIRNGQIEVKARTEPYF